VTSHLLKAAPKSSRLDAAPLRKRSSVRGETIVEVKPGDLVLGITSTWILEQFLEFKSSQPVAFEMKKETKGTKKPSTKNKTTTSRAIKKEPSKPKTAKPKPKPGAKKSTPKKNTR
jgi:hypothetical protein